MKRMVLRINKKIMKKYLIIITGIGLGMTIQAQDNVVPAKEENAPLFILHGTVHVGNGVVLENTSIRIDSGRIREMGPDISVSGTNAIVVEAKGKQVYPGLILPVT